MAQALGPAHGLVELPAQRIGGLCLVCADHRGLSRVVAGPHPPTPSPAAAGEGEPDLVLYPSAAAGEGEGFWTPLSRRPLRGCNDGRGVGGEGRPSILILPDIIA